MFRVFNCLGTEHDWRLVVLAGIVCFLASLAAVNLLHRAQALRGQSSCRMAVDGGHGHGIGGVGDAFHCDARLRSRLSDRL